MAEIFDEPRLIADGFERVYVELDWYDGPRAGVADIDGVPHYFYSDDWTSSVEADTYHVWPASEVAVAWEREQFAIFARWDEGYQTGAVKLETHPGHGGTDARYDELTMLLAPFRQPPDDARRFTGELRFVGGARYRVDGLDYWFKWHPST